MNKYEELFIARLDEQKAKDVEPTLEELERRANGGIICTFEEMVFNNCKAITKK